MGVGGIKISKAPTEPCGTCRRPVEISRWTTRSSHSGKALCREHGTLREPSASRYEPAYLPGYAPRSPRRPSASDLRAFAFLDEQNARRARYLRSLPASELREIGDQLTTEERATYATVLENDPYEYRDDDDGDWIYGPEPDGIPRVGRSYETRWWIDGYEDRGTLAPGEYELRTRA